LQHPHLSPKETWQELVDEAAKSGQLEQKEIQEEMSKRDALFRPSQVPAHQEILKLLRESEPDSIVIVAIGPLTNLAIAAAEDPEAFLRVKEVVVMGGNIDETGNVMQPPRPPTTSKTIPEPAFRLTKRPPGPLRDALTARNQVTPCAEFNTFADTVAAARLYALSSPTPKSTMPPIPPAPPGKTPTQAPPPYLQPYPEKLSRQLKVTLFPLDITNKHEVLRGEFRTFTEPLIASGSPLAEWVSAWLNSTFRKVESLQDDVSGDAVGLQLHDPLCIWYCITRDNPNWKLSEDEDIRIETSGQWTRGMCVVDRRSRRKREDDFEGDIPGDHGNWLSVRAGNRLGRCLESPGTDVFGTYMLKKIFES
jgi:inosine-uridine nucleoside N-ribohydrolase